MVRFHGQVRSPDWPESWLGPKKHLMCAEFEMLVFVTVPWPTNRAGWILMGTKRGTQEDLGLISLKSSGSNPSASTSFP